MAIERYFRNPRLRAGIRLCVKGEIPALNSSKSRTAYRSIAPALALSAAILLTGCEGQKIVARVNAQPILEEEFHDRVTRVTPNEFPQGTSFDAGGVTMMGMIVEKIKTQYAAEKNLLPSKEEVNKAVEYIKHSNPLLRSALKSGRFSDEDVVRRIRDAMTDFAIGTNGAKADQTKLNDLYKQRVATLTIPEAWIVQLLPINDPASGQAVLDELKRTGDFQKAAQMAGIPPQMAVNAGQETPIPIKNVDAATKAELDKLTPGKFADKPIKLTLTNPPQTATVVVKMIAREKEFVPSLDDVKFLLSQEIITQAQPQWQNFKNQQLAEATAKADVQINNKRYAYLRDIIRAQAAENARGMAAPSGMAPSGGGAAPGAGTAPPPGASSNAPSGGGAPSGAAPGSAPGASGSR